MEETQAVSLSTGMAPQAASSLWPCPAPSWCKKPQGKMPERLQKLLLL